MFLPCGSFSGIVLRALGIPVSMFTVLFAVARSVGWITQWKEMVRLPLLAFHWSAVHAAEPIVPPRCPIPSCASCAPFQHRSSLKYFFSPVQMEESTKRIARPRQVHIRKWHGLYHSHSLERGRQHSKAMEGTHDYQSSMSEG